MLRTTKQQVEVTVEENEEGEYRLSGHDYFHPTADYEYTAAIAAIKAHIASAPKPVTTLDLYDALRYTGDFVGRSRSGLVVEVLTLTETEAVTLMSLLEKVAK